MLMPDYIMIDSYTLAMIGWAALWAGLPLYFLLVAAHTGSAWLLSRQRTAVFQTDGMFSASANHITRAPENERELQNQPRQAAKVLTLQVDYERPPSTHHTNTVSRTRRAQLGTFQDRNNNTRGKTN